MCEMMQASGRFDPSACPLLTGLSHEEQMERMQRDPRIAACVSAISGGFPNSLRSQPLVEQARTRPTPRRRRTLPSRDLCSSVACMAEGSSNALSSFEPL
jgi:hypothetical protein